jgi:hypothetical protein
MVDPDALVKPSGVIASAGQEALLPLGFRLRKGRRTELE